MTLEHVINGAIVTKMEDGTIERLVAGNFEKGVNKALENLFGGYGDITKAIEGKIKEQMVKQIEGFDYTKYVAKLDFVLVEILKNTSLDHKKILNNFKELMTEPDFPKVVKLSDIFEQFKMFAAKEVDTSKLKVDYDDGVSYEAVTVTMEVEREESRSWNSFERAKVVFECEKDEELNCEIRLSKFDHFPWRLDVEIDSSIASLRHLDIFKTYLLKLRQSGREIDIDLEFDEYDVRPDAEPEASYS